jgi:hypothetical protein
MNKPLAKWETKKAIKDGRLIKPSECERCQTPTEDLQIHHPDYSKPLEIKWFCFKCHHAEHRALGTGRGKGKLRPIMHRKVTKSGNTLRINLPKPYCELHNLKDGDLMALIFGESLRITPINKGE